MLLLAACVAGAQTTESKKAAIKKLDVQRFHKLVVDASIDVLLIEDDAPGKLYIEGDSSYFHEITLTEKDGVLSISGVKDRSYKKRIYIGLPVQYLRELEVNADAFVVGMNTIKSSELSVTVNQHGRVSIKVGSVALQ